MLVHHWHAVRELHGRRANGQNQYPLHPAPCPSKARAGTATARRAAGLGTGHGPRLLALRGLVGRRRKAAPLFGGLKKPIQVRAVSDLPSLLRAALHAVLCEAHPGRKETHRGGGTTATRPRGNPRRQKGGSIGKTKGQV